MLNSKRVFAIYLEEDEVERLQSQLHLLCVRAKIHSIKTLATEFRDVLELQQTLRDLTTSDEED